MTNSINGEGLSVAFVTLGCKLNFSESSTLAREFVSQGYKKVVSSQPADIYVINTCSVTEHADKKCRNAIRKLHKLNRDAIIAVTGCYAQLNPDEILAIEGVDLVLGADQKSNLYARVAQLIEQNKQGDKVNSIKRAYSCEISQVESIFAAYSSDDRTRSFLKVQDGCDYHCSYCTIPLARGKSRNHPISSLIEQAKEIASKGIKEIILTGVNTGDFGRSSGESFLDLLVNLSEIEGIERIRVSSIEPNLLSKELIELIASNNKFLPHFHIPLQSGSNEILGAMRRRYNRELFAQKLALIKESIPHAFIGVDVIVGFPGESEELFMESYNFLATLKPSFLHVFPYSKRENTPAASFENQIDESVKSHRVAALTELSNLLHQEFIDSNRGREEYVLFERAVKGGKIYGYTRNYIRVERPYSKGMEGEIIKVIL